MPLQNPHRHRYVDLLAEPLTFRAPTMVIDSFAKLRAKLDLKYPASKTPQLLICGHGAVDDPDATIIYSQVLELLEQERYAPYAAEYVSYLTPTRRFH